MPKHAALSAIFHFGKIGIRRKHPSSSQAFFVYVVLRVKDSGQNNGEVRRILRGLELPFQVPRKNQEILRKNEAKARVSHSGWTVEPFHHSLETTQAASAMSVVMVANNSTFERISLGSRHVFNDGAVDRAYNHMYS